MRKPLVKRIFARTDQTDFVGRASHVERLLKIAERGSGGLVLLATPSVGSSELLRHVYDRLFIEQDETIPFYFEIRKSDRTAQNAAVRFLREFLLQTVAFRRCDSRIIDAAPEISEIADLAVAEDGYWIDRLIEAYSNDGRSNDELGFTRNCLSAPLRAASSGVRPFVLIDDVHLLSKLEGGDAFFDDIREVFGRSTIPFVLSGERRALFASTSFQTMPLDVFSFTEAGTFAERLSARFGVEINDQTRDLIAVQLGGNATQIVSLFASAAANACGLNSFEQVEQIYTDEIFGGRIGRYFDGVFDESIPDVVQQSKVLWLLTETLAARSGHVPVAYWKRHSGLSGSELDRTLDALHNREIVNVGSGSVEIDTSSTVLSDYIAARKRLEIEDETRALAVGDALAENLKRAPQLMARHYRRTSAIGLRGLLRAFDGRRISSALFEYSRFKAEFKGADDKRILRALKDDDSLVDLPRLVYTAHTAAFYPKLNEQCEPERSAVGLGFRDTAGKEETAWIAVQVDSKLEATRDLVQFWCDRLEMAALNSNFEDHQIWLIAPEGFDDDAVAALEERSAFGSSRKQVELLAELLNADLSADPTIVADEYEIVVPMGEDTEMIAAHTIEEIAKRHNFSTKAINQIKTALVEACINATEHSLSPDRRIHQKFSVAADKITITVTNRGVRLADKQPNPDAPDAARRGWGLKLIKGLMDEVRIEKTDDGTQITMIKYLQKAAAAETA
ncbi:MAG: ATP-binding protein [Pyrinomonadaceae bacterium]